MGNTKVDLVRDLEEVAQEIMDETTLNKIMRIVRNAERGMYHDFDSELATPKMQLHVDLLAAGLTEIDKKMQNGDYDDESPTSEQEKELMESLLNERRKN